MTRSRRSTTCARSLVHAHVGAGRRPGRGVRPHRPRPSSRRPVGCQKSAWPVSCSDAPVGFQSPATGHDLGFYAARSCSLMRPPCTCRRLIRVCSGGLNTLTRPICFGTSPNARYVHQPPRSRVVNAGPARPAVSSLPGGRARAAQVAGWLRVTAPSADRAAETRATPFSLAIEARGRAGGCRNPERTAARLRAETYRRMDLANLDGR